MRVSAFLGQNSSLAAQQRRSAPAFSARPTGRELVTLTMPGGQTANVSAAALSCYELLQEMTGAKPVDYRRDPRLEPHQLPPQIIPSYLVGFEELSQHPEFSQRVTRAAIETLLRQQVLLPIQKEEPETGLKQLQFQVLPYRETLGNGGPYLRMLKQFYAHAKANVAAQPEYRSFVNWYEAG